MKIRLLIAVVLLGTTLAVGVGSVNAEPLSFDAKLQSRALDGPIHALIQLPRGYWQSRRRYPVVYFLHGLPAGPTSYSAERWVDRALEKAGPAILVSPQGARAGDTDPEYLDWGAGRDWETFISRELTDYVDAHFRTIPSRRGRAIIGLSAGGYGAAMIGINNLDRFSVIESWSGYFHPTNPAGTAPIDGGPTSNVHTLLPKLARDELRRATFVALYVGSQDKRFLAENLVLDRQLRAASIPHVFAVYKGGHDAGLWKSHATPWLRLALAHLEQP
jgi:putative tributyrin esterase